MGAKILTGYTGERHITPLDDAAVYRALFGAGSYITGEGESCAASMPTVTEFDILNGHLSLQGIQIRITAEALTVDVCPTGSARKDLVVARWTHDTETLIDEVELAVLKGTEVPSGTTPELPSYNEGVIGEGATAVDMPLYVIELNGSNVTYSRVAEVLSGNIGDGTVVVITVPSFSSLPLTINDSRIMASHIAVNAVLSNPQAQTSDWTVNTEDGAMTLSGSIGGSTGADIYLAVRR